MYKKVLLPTDGSDNALKAAQYTVHLIETHPGVEVTLINVYKILPEFRTYESPFTPGIVESVKEMSQRALTKTLAVFEQAGLKVEAVSLEGDPGTEIVAFANKGGYDHIIIGSRGMGLSGLIFGSVAQKVLHFASCPVTTIKA
jgi:nucleotide-binding universal stress UspA family protein